MEKNIKLERINNSLNNIWNEFSYRDETQVYNAYKMLLFWWMDQNPRMIDYVYKLSRQDRMDFFSSTSYACIKIMNGKIKNWNSFSGRRLPNKYIMANGIMISINTVELGMMTNHMIDYMTHCIGTSNELFASFHKYEGELENDWEI